MTNYDSMPPNDHTSSNFTLRDLLAIAFRRKQLAAICFFGILAGAVLTVLLTPSEYKATTQFMLARERMDPVLTPEVNSPVSVRADVSEEEINSEVALLQNNSVLAQVVTSCGLDKRKSLLDPIFRIFGGGANPDKKLAEAVTRLASDLKIEPGKKSNLISVSYSNTDPQLAARVLRSLDDAYLQKHIAVHSAPGQVHFFDQEMERYKKNLTEAEEQINQFSKQEDGVAPQVARDMTLQKLTEFRSTLQQTRAETADVEERIRTMEKQAQTTPERLMTAIRQDDDTQVLQEFKNTLMKLELKRTELLTKYQPTYALVKEVDKEIADTRASIATEETKPIKSETTDRNPTYAWLNEELAKAKAEFSGLQARAAATVAIVARYEAKARDMQQKGLIEQTLLRSMKANEESYLLYLRKREQARMTEALDSTRILNVAIAEQPTVPSVPSNPAWLVLLLGTSMATTVTLGAISIKEYLDTSFRTPTEVAEELNIPVLASVPLRSNGFHTNGNGHGGGHRGSPSSPSATVSANF
jgi:uncharacterized protein involved in exopolysaccharide biosynthesis